MKAIDRAAYWAEMLEQVGFDIECETEIDLLGDEFLTVRAEQDHTRVQFTVLMSTKFTRFINGYSGNGYMLGKPTRKPSRMSLWVSMAIEREEWLAQHRVSA